MNIFLRLSIGIVKNIANLTEDLAKFLPLLFETLCLH